jgi:WD40 repeat protein/serine/threonine protein kinase
VEALLRAHESAGTFMEAPAAALRPASAPSLSPERNAADPRPEDSAQARPTRKDERAGNPADEAVGQTIGRYKLLEKLGEGGCGVVYVAEQTEPVRRCVALKVIKLGMDTEQVIARFEAERQALAMMDHPNIAKVLDGGATETGGPYFVMELVRSIPITHYCDQVNLTTRQRLELFIKVCQAIQHTHQKGIIHRDIKPSNILVTLHDGVPVPKVIDFGIAKAIEGRLTDATVYTQLHQFIGTPAYMSPEQAELTGLDIDTRSDIYSLGVLLYELLAGSTPFDAKELMAAGLDAMRKIIREQEPVRPSTRFGILLAGDSTTTAKRRSTDTARLAHQLRGDLDWIVMKCLEKDRSRRYETANGLAFDLKRHLNDEPVLARPPSAAYRLQKAFRRNKVLYAAGSVVLLALVLGLGSASVLLVREKVAKHGLNGALARLEMDKSEGLFAADEPSTALAYLVHASRRNALAEVTASRLFSALTYHTFGIRLAKPLPHGDEVWSARFSSDGRRVVTASKDHTARVWDAQTGQPLTGPLHHEASVSSARFSPDGRRVVTASEDKTARVWSAQTGQALTAPLQHLAAVLDAEFSLDGSWVVTASDDKTARVWDVQTSQPLTPPLQHNNRVVTAQFSPDGQRVATASWDKTARVWNAQTGQALTGAFRHTDGLQSVEFSPDGQRLLTAAGRKAQVWDAQTGQRLGNWIVHSGGIESAQFSPDGQRVITTSRDYTARVWDAQTGLPLGQVILQGSNGQLGLPLTEPFRHTAPVNFAQFSPDGQRVVTASSDHTAQIWDARTGEPLTELFRHYQSVWSAEFSPDGQRVVTASQDASARVWDMKPGQPLTERMQHPTDVGFAEFSPDGQHVATASGSSAQVWDAQTGERLTGPVQHAALVFYVHYSPDGQRLVTASADHTARVWDAATGQPLSPPLQHGEAVRSAEFSSDGRRVVTASQDKTARVWDAQSGRALTDPLRHEGEVFYARFSPDGLRVVTASQDKTARVWNAQTGQALTGPLQHQANVCYAEFSPDGSRVATASYDQTVRVWDTETGQPLTESLQQRGFGYRVRFSLVRMGSGW